MFTYRNVISVIRAAGYVEVRCKGDHHFYKHPVTGVCFTVPGKSSGSTVSKNVVKSIERTTGLSIRR